jgi:hypothetical protein
MAAALQGHVLEVQRQWADTGDPALQCLADSLLQPKNVLIAVARSGEADVDRFW